MQHPLCLQKGHPNQIKVAPAALKHHTSIGCVSYPSLNQYFKHKFTEIHFVANPNIMYTAKWFFETKYDVHCLEKNPLF